MQEPKKTSPSMIGYKLVRYGTKLTAGAESKIKWYHFIIWLGLIVLTYLIQEVIIEDKLLISIFVIPLLYGVLKLPKYADFILFLFVSATIVAHSLDHFTWASCIMLLSAFIVLGTTSVFSRTILYLLQRERAFLIERERVNEQLVYAFAKTIEYKDEYTMGHSIRVAEYARSIAKQLGLSEHYVDRVYVAGLLHDVGKIGVPESILQKKGSLTLEERNAIQKHVELGERIMNGISGFQNVAVMIADHHERWDGLGYPKGKKGNAINLGGRILAVADAFDAMTSKRAYREPVGMNEAYAELLNCSGSQFDTQIVKAFLKARDFTAENTVTLQAM